MPHPLIDQFRFTRREWLRGWTASQKTPHNILSDELHQLDRRTSCLARTPLLARTCPGQNALPQVNEVYAYGAPMSTPSLGEMLETWQTVTQAADPTP